MLVSAVSVIRRCESTRDTDQEEGLILGGFTQV